MCADILTNIPGDCMCQAFSVYLLQQQQHFVIVYSERNKKGTLDEIFNRKE